MSVNNRIKNERKRSDGSLVLDDLKRAYYYFEGKCPYSLENIDSSNWHLEHIIPVSMGGTTDSWNCIPVCAECNLEKSNKHPLDYWDKIHDSKDEKYLEKLFNYIFNEVKNNKNYGLKTKVSDQEIENLIFKEEMEHIENESFDFELDTFYLLYEILNHMNNNKQYIEGNINVYKEKLNELYSTNKKHIVFDIDLYKNREIMTNYLKKLGVINHYSIPFDLIKNNIVDVEKIRKNIDEISLYLGKEIKINEIINKNPLIMLMSYEKFKNDYEYLTKKIGYTKESIINSPTLLNEIDTAQELYDTCLKVGFDIKNFTKSSLDYGNIKNFVKLLNSEEYKNHPELFTSTTLTKEPDEIKKIINLPIFSTNKYRKLLKKSLISVIKADRLMQMIELAEKYEISDYLENSIGFLRKNPIQNETLIKYLIDNDISLIVDNKLNPILLAPKKVLLEKYSINIDSISTYYLDKGEKII